MAAKASTKKFIPGDDNLSEDIFQYPFTIEDDTIDFIKKHGNIMFIIRGLPGTGKESLYQMLAETYETAVVCSADLYYTDTFTSKNRTQENLKKSHAYCHEKVREACIKNKSPIIVKNTHVKKSEFEPYLKFANEFNYTVIMIVTMDKFKVSPQILARSNTKGLTVDYFRNRLNQWCNCYPEYMGWFLCSKDTSCLQKQLQDAMDSLLGDGKFCHVMDVYSTDNLLNKYLASKVPFCVAACWEHSNEHVVSSYYLSDVVYDNYGRCGTITIEGFLVSMMDVLAVVHLDDTKLPLTNIAKLKFNSKVNTEEHDDMDSILQDLDKLSIHPVGSCNNFNSLKKTFHGEGITLKICQRSENVNVKNCSLMYLAKSELNKNVLAPQFYIKKYIRLLNEVADSNGLVTSDKFDELENDYISCRLPDDTWLVRPSQAISVAAIFTGSYK